MLNSLSFTSKFAFRRSSAHGSAPAPTVPTSLNPSGPCQQLFFGVEPSEMKPKTAKPLSKSEEKDFKTQFKRRHTHLHGFLFAARWLVNTVALVSGCQLYCIHYVQASHWGGISKQLIAAYK